MNQATPKKRLTNRLRLARARAALRPKSGSSLNSFGRRSISRTNRNGFTPAFSSRKEPVSVSSSLKASTINRTVTEAIFFPDSAAAWRMEALSMSTPLAPLFWPRASLSGHFSTGFSQVSRRPEWAVTSANLRASSARRSKGRSASHPWVGASSCAQRSASKASALPNPGRKAPQ